VFATVGISSFLAANRAAVFSRRGGLDNFTSTDTLVGKTREEGVEESSLEWSTSFEEEHTDPTTEAHIDSGTPSEWKEMHEEVTIPVWSDGDEREWLRTHAGGGL
jgi:hypothetical protein